MQVLVLLVGLSQVWYYMLYLVKVVSTCGTLLSLALLVVLVVKFGSSCGFFFWSSLVLLVLYGQGWFFLWYLVMFTSYTCDFSQVWLYMYVWHLVKCGYSCGC